MPVLRSSRLIVNDSRSSHPVEEKAMSPEHPAKTAHPGDLWEKLGSLEELESFSVLTNLFILYETRLQKNPEDSAALDFFHHLALVLERATSCNLNRR